MLIIIFQIIYIVKKKKEEPNLYGHVVFVFGKDKHNRNYHPFKPNLRKI